MKHPMKAFFEMITLPELSSCPGPVDMQLTVPPSSLWRCRRFRRQETERDPFSAIQDLDILAYVSGLSQGIKRFFLNIISTIAASTRPNRRWRRRRWPDPAQNWRLHRP
jgi:hypothetical protein